MDADRGDSRELTLLERIEQGLTTAEDAALVRGLMAEPEAVLVELREIAQKALSALELRLLEETKAWLIGLRDLE